MPAAASMTKLIRRNNKLLDEVDAWGSMKSHTIKITAVNETTAAQRILVLNSRVSWPLYFFCHSMYPEKRTNGRVRTTNIRL